MGKEEQNIPISTGAAMNRRPSRGKIVTYLRKRIVEGKLRPGDRIPLRVELAEKFGASSATVQNAVDQLRQDGFVRVSGRQATFVSNTPPHLFNYAMVLPGQPGDYPDGMIHTLTNIASAADPAGKKKVDVYFGIEPHIDNKGYLSLVNAIENDKYAGLIFPIHPDRWLPRDCPLASLPGIPRVSTGGTGDFEDSSNNPPIAHVRLNTYAFIDKALDYLASRGCTRIAVLAGGYKLFDVFKSKAVEKNLIIHPYWLQSVCNHHEDHIHAARNCTHLLLHDGQQERPDGLIISDSILIEPAMAGIVAAGVKIPGQLNIVAHCNFPYHGRTMLPIKRLGFDMRTVMELFIESIDTQRAEQGVSEKIVLPIFDEQANKHISNGTKVQGLDNPTINGANTSRTNYDVGAI